MHCPPRRGCPFSSTSQSLSRNCHGVNDEGLRITAIVWDVRVFTDTIKDGVNTFSVRYLQDSLHGVFLFVDDNVVGTILSGKRRFLLGRSGPDDGSAARFGDLAQEKAQTTGNGVDQYDVTLLDVIRFLRKACRSETLKEYRSRGASRDRIGNGVHVLPWDRHVLCMPTRGLLHGIVDSRICITGHENWTHHGDAGSLLVSTFLIFGIVEHGRVGGQASDHPSRLAAKDIGEIRNGIEASSA